MKLISWNINGIRSCLKKGLAEFIASSEADIICLQEVRATPDQVNVSFPGYSIHWNPAEKKGYSGTAILSRLNFKSLKTGMSGMVDDSEGRVITAELDSFYLVNVYTPNSGRDLLRLDYRTKEWDPAFLRYLKFLETEKPVVFCGDLNVAHQEIDLANPKANRGNAGFTDEERATFDNLLHSGFVDSFRSLTPDGGHFTWWSNFARARERNIGWRIDYFGISESLTPRLKAASIHPAVMGSDHCPISTELDF